MSQSQARRWWWLVAAVLCGLPIALVLLHRAMVHRTPVVFDEPPDLLVVDQAEDPSVIEGKERLRTLSPRLSQLPACDEVEVFAWKDPLGRPDRPPDRAEPVRSLTGQAAAEIADLWRAQSVDCSYLHMAL